MKFLTFISMLLAAATDALPQHSNHVAVNPLPNLYTLTAHVPSNKTLNGLKVNWGGALNLFQAKVSSYCPVINNSTSHCPNGTETVFAGALHPVSQARPESRL